MGQLLCSTSGAACVIISESAEASIAKLADLYRPKETGGILLGYYDDAYRMATIVVAAAPPRDSVHSRTSFYRGDQDVEALIRWGKKQTPALYYIGEWHTHPGATPKPSQVDIRQLKAFAKIHNYGAVTPLLLIAGGQPPSLIWQATLIQQDNQLETLLPI